MAITIPHPHITKNPKLTGSITAALVAAVAIVAGLQFVGNDESTVPAPAAEASTETVTDPTGLGAALSVQYDTAVPARSIDATGLGAALAVSYNDGYVSDPTGLGQVFGVEFPGTAQSVDMTGLGAVFGVEFPDADSAGG